MTPNHALQRTAPCVTAPASAAAFPPAMQVPRRTPRSLSLRSLGRKEYCPFAEPSYFRDMTIKAVVHKAEEGGFWAEVPALPGCVTQGETEEEIKANLHEAVELWLEAGDPETTQNQEDKILELAL